MERAPERRKHSKNKVEDERTICCLWGGYWERLIRILKNLLRRILGQASVTYEELQTILCDCEATMNGRPLTFINDDTCAYLEPLTPACFIQPLQGNDVTDFDEIDATNLNRRLKYIHSLREQFRNRFKSEYLTTLVQKGTEKTDHLQINDVVLIETDEKRIKWPLGIVQELYMGKDGVNRTARVKTSTGTKIRPVQRLYKLEVTGNLIPAQLPSPRDTDLADAPATLPPSLGDHRDRPPQSTRCGRKVKLPSKFDLYV